MTTATLPPEFQDLADGPGELGPADDGKVPAWSWPDRRLIMLPWPTSAERQLIVRAGGGGTTNHAALLNLDFAGSGHTGFEPAGAGAAAVADHVAESDPHTQYLKESDYVAGVTNHALLSNLDYASSGHTGFEAAGTAAAAITTHVGLADPHTQYLLESGVSAYGATLIDDVDAAAARGTLGLGTMATATETNYLLADGSRTGATSAEQVFEQNNTSTTSIVKVRQLGTGDAVLSFVEDSTWSIGVRGGSFRIGNTTTVNVSTFYLAPSTGRLGLGTTGPLAPLHIQTTGVAANTDVIRAGNSGSDFAVGYLANGVAVTGAYMRASASLPIVLGTSSNINSGGAFRVTDAGFCAFGVGNDAPTATADAYSSNASASTIQNTIVIRTTNAGTPGAGFGVGFRAGLKSSTTTDQDAGRLTWEWVTATHATRASRGKLTAYYTSTEQIAMTWDGDTGGLKLAFYGGTPVAKAAAYTQSYSTADRTLSAYTADNESAAYTGIDNAQAGSVYAQLTDLNNLRVAYENLRAFVEDLAQHHNSLLDDMQALNLVG